MKQMGYSEQRQYVAFVSKKLCHNNDHGIYVFALFDEYIYELMYIVGKLLEILSKWNGIGRILRYVFVAIVSFVFISCFVSSKIITK